MVRKKLRNGVQERDAVCYTHLFCLDGVSSRREWCNGVERDGYAVPHLNHQQPHLDGVSMVREWCNGVREREGCQDPTTNGPP
jgi:hypothetical protein